MSQTQTDDRPMSLLVADEVRAYMARRRISGNKAAQALGWSAFYMSRRLKGAVAFNVDELAQLAELLGVPVTAFFEGPEMVMSSGGNKRTYSTPLYLDIRSTTCTFSSVEASRSTSVWDFVPVVSSTIAKASAWELVA